MIYLCDFEDSFTYNIFTELHLQHLEVKLIKKNEIKKFLENKILEEKKCFIILGPGPGHPREYQEVVALIRRALKLKHLSFFGICLGHQLICEALGFAVENSFAPKHGERVEIHLQEKIAKAFLLKSKLIVQRYNSLAVPMSDAHLMKLKKDKLEYFSFEKDLMGIKGKNFISFQFHPESVGTSFRSQFFRALHNF